MSMNVYSGPPGGRRPRRLSVTWTASVPALIRRFPERLFAAKKPEEPPMNRHPLRPVTDDDVRAYTVEVLRELGVSAFAGARLRI